MPLKMLLLAAAAIAGPAQAEWWEAKTDHFTIYSEGKSTDAKALATELERVDMAMRVLQNVSPDDKPSVPVTVFRFGDTDDIGALISSRGVAGFYIPRSSGSVAFVPAERTRDLRSLGTRSDGPSDLESDNVLFHEYAHHFMLQYFPARYPAWYIEAFAEVYGTIEIQPDGVFRVGNPANHRAGQLFYDLPFPAKRLFVPAEDLVPGDQRHFYSVGWLTLHYLTFDDTRKGQLKTYLDLVNSGKTSMEAAQTAFGDLDKLSREVKSYLRKRLQGIEVKPAFYEAPEVAVRQLDSGEDAIMRDMIRSKRGVRKREADSVVASARNVAAQYPNSIMVLQELVEAEFDAKNFDEADRAADRLIALDAENAEAMTYKGQIRMERAKENPAIYADARKYFRSAYLLEPSSAVALAQNYVAYRKGNETPPESAVIGLEEAYRLAPYDPEVRLLLVRQLVEEKRTDAALTVIAPLRQSAHSTDKRQKSVNEAAVAIEKGALDDARMKITQLLDQGEDDDKD